MHAFLETWRAWLLAAVVIIFAVFVYFGLPKTPTTTVACTDVPITKNVDGTQGYRIWSGDTLKSFEHNGRAVCVPKGWEPIGAIAQGEGWAQFEPSYTGVLIKSDAFTGAPLLVKGSAYDITLRYRATTDPAIVAKYEAMATAAVTRVASLYADAPNQHRPLTFLVTAGLAGNTIDDNTRVYPDPTAALSIIVRTPNQTRSEELVVHSIAHVYNRFRTDLSDYTKNQAPFTEEDWQENEAAWEEVAFSTSAIGRVGRLEYLLNVHKAVMTHNFSLIEYPPFNNAAAFKKIVPSAFVPPTASYLDDQYGHYVLAPLAMVATDGLLQKGGKTSLSKVLRGIHTGTISNFYDELKKDLSASDYKRVVSWFDGTGTIPSDLVYAAAKSYSK